MTGRFKRHVFEGTAMSRTTAWRKRKRMEAANKKDQDHVRSDQGDSEEVLNISAVPSVQQPTTTERCVNEPLSAASTRCGSASLPRVLREEIASGIDKETVADDHEARIHVAAEPLLEGIAGVYEADEPDARCKDLSSEPAVQAGNEEVSDKGSNNNSHTGSTSIPTFAQDDVASMRKKVCPCTDTTVGDVLAMVLALGLRHNLTWAAQVDILKMVNAVSGKDIIPASKHKYLKHLQDEKDDFEVHLYCNKCEVYLGARPGSAGCVYCEQCEQDVNVSDSSNYFVSLSLASQMKKLLSDPAIASLLLNYRFDRKKSNESAIEDIYDGHEYRKLCVNGGVLSSRFNFSYTFFTDGCPFGKSSNKTIWPIYISINELPPKERSLYICLVGLYVGPKDPNLNVFLQPFVDQGNRLSCDGFEWTLNGETVVSRVVPLCAIADSVARPMMLNRQSFGAYYGCTFCYQKAEGTRRGRRFTVTEGVIEERTLESLHEDLAMAYSKRYHPEPGKRHHRGVKGPTPLMSLSYFNVTTGVVVDCMHNILLGVVRTHMDLLFESTRKKFWVGMAQGNVGLAHLESAIDERLLNIRPPTFITRTPRSIVSRKHWRANEWRTWLLFYGVPCLMGLLEDKYVVHFAMLSKATHLLLQKSVSVNDISIAHNLFLCYSFLFQKYFGECEMVYNVHLLSHIASGVYNWGPLWTHNAFYFEGQNRFLLQLCKSPHLLAFQVAKKFLIFNSFSSLSSRLLASEYPAEFCFNVLNKRVKYFCCSGDAILLGRGKCCNTLSSNSIECLSLFGVFYGDCLSYERIIYNGSRYVCDTYRCSKTKQNDSVVFTTDGHVVRIKHILLTSDSNLVLCVQRYEVANASVERPHPLVPGEVFSFKEVRKVVGEGPIMCITQNSIKGPCTFVDTQYGQYVSPVPFGCRYD